MIADIRAILNAWNLPAPERSAPLWGMEHVVLLDMPGGARLVLKETVGTQPAALQMQYKILAYLHASGVPGALAVQVIFTAIFAKPAKPELIRKNLDAFYWLHSQKRAIQAACGA